MKRLGSLQLARLVEACAFSGSLVYPIKVDSPKTGLRIALKDGEYTLTTCNAIFACLSLPSIME